MTEGLTGLFLGAGASYEVGMPLVWDITARITTWLTPDKLRGFNEGWRSQGGGYSDEVIDDLTKMLVLPNQHYESVLGHLETQFRRHANRHLLQQYHGLYSWLVDAVYQILCIRHIRIATYIDVNLHYFEGMANLAKTNAPLWIFSLNHDLVIECLAAKYGIPVNSGYTTDIVTLPRRDKHGAQIGELKAETITAEQLEKSGMPFYQLGTLGVNLLKIHGALDVFAFRNGEDLLKLLPLEASVAGVIEALRAANEELLYIDPRQPERPVKVTNEIAYADEAGEMQFLRRSLLAGAFKFTDPQRQVLPTRLLDYFKSYINYVQSLVCIGYGFGDIHINQVLRGWLEFAADRKLEIVSPHINEMPSFLLHLAPQVTLIARSATDYLDRVGGIKRTRKDELEKQLAAIARPRGKAETVISDFNAFLPEYLKQHIQTLIEKIPVKDGQPDLDSLGMPQDEFLKKILLEAGFTHENMLEVFFKTQSDKSK